MSAENEKRPIEGPPPRGGKLDDRWLEQFYSRVTDQFTLSRQSLHNTHQWAMTLTLGLVTAVLTLGNGQSGYPNEFGLIAVVVAVPLMFRFFARSCLEYSIHEKWRAIRNASDCLGYVRGAQPNAVADAKAHLKETIEVYYFAWKCPLSLRAVVWRNLQLAYLWPSLLLTGLLVWGFWRICVTPLLGAALCLTLVFMMYELYSLVTYRGFRFASTDTPVPPFCV